MGMHREGIEAMDDVLEQLIAAVNVELEAGNWPQVVTLTAELYQCALAGGEQQFAELVQDLHWIAYDAVAHPLEVTAMVQP
jgi:hypothetical protein